MDADLRALERRFAETGSAEDRRRLDVALERRDGAVGRFENELVLLIAYAFDQAGDPADDPADGVAFAEDIRILTQKVLGLQGYYGSDGTYGQDPGIADLVWASTPKGVVEALVAFDDERGMVTIGASASPQQDLYTPWPELRLYTVEESGLTNRRAAVSRWTERLSNLREPWRIWSRARRELAIRSGIPIYDRIRIPEEIARRWLVLSPVSDAAG